MSYASLLNLATEQAATWAARLADGELPVEQQDEFQAWLDADALNGQVLEEIVGAWRAVEHYATNPQMMALREAALASARRTLRQRESRTPARRIWGLIAATLLLAVCGGGVWAWLTPNIYQTGVGERQVVVLADGSRISLDGATEVRVRYSHENRRLWLDRGRAKFEVAKDSLRPFSVTAADKVVVATGTAFSVERVQSQVRVVLYEGHVALLERSGARTPHAIAVRSGAGQMPADRLLKPGREMILSEATSSVQDAPMAVVAADPVRSLSWEGGQMVFEDESLGVAVERMNRYAERPLRIGDQAAADVRISGVFRAGDTEALVQGLNAAFGVRARVGPNATVLYKGAGD